MILEVMKTLKITENRLKKYGSTYGAEYGKYLS